ncbi:hypothetical protein J4760_00660 [Salinicoccus sp. ID82-1]|uniref:hypothetical protein n=1 Tax=Salinicoccus sp. ID82-1 TaxID=2820269 RepID=UPI001F3A557B|nr:hypothetical protein [Salinicoccus sp. ID82-1]MCG1008553.1 hypothetical protein [Salinicoccus sp. ID82-1]
MERKWGINFIRVASLFGLLGVFIGSQMAGEVDYSIRPIHTHVLLVGWLSMFAWGIFYSIYRVKSRILVHIHGVMGMVGAIMLTSGMYFYMLNPFNFNETFTTVYFIVGGSVLLIAFLLFIIVTFFVEKDGRSDQNW